MSASVKPRHGWIGLLRALAMMMVILPHLLAYRFSTDQMNYFGYYVLNPLHIIQFCGAMGVSIFFITSGYLSVSSMGSGNYLGRLYKSVVVILIQVFAAIMFCWLFISGCGFFFDRAGYTNTYAVYTAKDWLETALLYRGIMYLPSVEVVLWFLIPFLLFKLLLLILDIVCRGNPRISVYVMYVLFAGLWIWQGWNADLYLLTERFFYILIILVGFAFGLLHKGRIGRREFLLMQLLNIVGMLVGEAMSRVGVDDGYITSVIYAVVLFYAAYKIKESIPQNLFISYFDKIGLSFYLLHNSVGWIIAQGLYFIVFRETHVWASLLIALVLDIAIITLYSYLVANPLDRLLTSFLSKKKHAPKHLEQPRAD